MVGLTVILEGHMFSNNNNNNNNNSRSISQVVNKASRMMMMMKKSAASSPSSCSPSPSSPCSKNNPFSKRNTPATVPATGFLDCCFLCKQKLLLGKDIYMYKGDTAFCSVECRCRQIIMDEEEAAMALKPPKHKTNVHQLLSFKSFPSSSHPFILLAGTIQ